MRLSGRINLFFHFACTGAHIIGGTPFYRETQNCIKTFLKIFVGGDRFDDSSRKKLKLNGIVLPVVGEDATTLDLNLVPQVVEFEGFINYGSPINVVGVNTIAGAITTSVPVLLTENVINQPVFSTPKVVITPSGLAFNNEEEEEEGLLPPASPEVPAL